MITISEVKDLKEAERLWRALSPQETIFDEWDFRYSFYKYKPYKLCFLVAYEMAPGGKEVVGLLPLEHNTSWGGLEFFAEEHCEESRPFIKPGYEKIIPKLYAATKGVVKCDDITGEDEFTRSLPIEDYIYVLPLKKIKTWEDYLKARLSAKKQRNFRSDCRKVEAANPKIFYSRQTDIDFLFHLNSVQFNDSYLQLKEDRDGWKDLLSLPFNWEIVSIEIDGQVQAASLSVLYKNNYLYLINGTNKTVLPGLGKYLNRVNLERAIALGANVWDSGLGDCTWKTAWHLDRIPQYYFHKGVKE